jgi:hypothetical protein
MQHLHLLSLEAFDVFLEIKMGETFFQILAEGFQQFASVDSTQLILCCKFIFEFTRARAIMTPEQAHAAVLAGSSRRHAYKFGPDNNASMSWRLRMKNSNDRSWKTVPIGDFAWEATEARDPGHAAPF